MYWKQLAWTLMVNENDAELVFICLLWKCKGLHGGNILFLEFRPIHFWFMHYKWKKSSSLFQQSTTAELKALPSYPFSYSVSLCWKAVEPKPNHSMIRLGFFSRRLAKPYSGCKPFHTYELMSIHCLPFVLSSFHTCTSVVTHGYLV